MSTMKTTSALQIASALAGVSGSEAAEVPLGEKSLLTDKSLLTPSTGHRSVEEMQASLSSLSSAEGENGTTTPLDRSVSFAPSTQIFQELTTPQVR